MTNIPIRAFNKHGFEINDIPLIFITRATQLLVGSNLMIPVQLTVLVFAPCLFFELAKTTQHDFGSATQRGADYAKGLETCRYAYLG